MDLFIFIGNFFIGLFMLLVGSRVINMVKIDKDDPIDLHKKQRVLKLFRVSGVVMMAGSLYWIVFLLW